MIRKQKIRDWAFEKLKGQGDKWTDRKKEVREPVLVMNVK